MLYKKSYNLKRYAIPLRDKYQDLLFEIIALHPNALGLLTQLRQAGGEDLISSIHELIGMGKISELRQLSNPENLAKYLGTDMTNIHVSGASQAIGEIIGLVDQVKNQNLLSSQTINYLEQNKSPKLHNQVLNKLNNIADLFSDQVIKELESNPLIVPALRSERTGLGYGAGVPSARLTTDLFDTEGAKVFANYGSFFTNFMNLLTTLLYEHAVKSYDFSSVVPEKYKSVEISTRANYAFVSMVSNTTDYDIAKWVEVTNEEGNKNVRGLLEDLTKPAEKNLALSKKILDLPQIKDSLDPTYYKTLKQAIEIFEDKKLKKSPDLEIALAKIGLSEEQINNIILILKKEKSAYGDALISLLPSELQGQYYIAKNFSSDDNVKGENRGRDIRTVQLLGLRRGVVNSWASHYKKIFSQLNQETGITEDQFVQLMDLERVDSEIRKNILELASPFGAKILNWIKPAAESYDLDVIDSVLEGIDTPDADPSASNLINSIKELRSIIKNYSDIMQSGSLDPSHGEILNTIILIKDKLLELKSLSVMKPPISRLWNEGLTINVGSGYDYIMDPNLVSEISKPEILRAAGFDPMASQKLVDVAVKKTNDESLPQYKSRVAQLLPGLIESGNLASISDWINEKTIESPLSQIVLPQMNTNNSSLKVIRTIVDSVLEAEEYKGASIENFEELGSIVPNQAGKDRIERKRVLDELLDLAGLNRLAVGDVVLYPQNKNVLDPLPELAEVGLSTDSGESRYVIDLFRNVFNLPICSYEVEINSPEECKWNRNGFRMDFTILADKLVINGDGTYGIIPQIILAGETFGYTRYTGHTLIVDSDQKQDLDRNRSNLALYQDGASSPDGKYNIFSEEDENGNLMLMSTFPMKDKQTGEERTEKRKADRYVEYMIRKSYKEPYEKFLSSIVKADVIFVPPFDISNGGDIKKAEDSVKEQLDNLMIIWRSADSMSKACELINQNPELVNSELKDKYLLNNEVQLPYSYTELYGHTLMLHYDLQNIAIPMYYSDPSKFDIRKMIAFQKQFEVLNQRINNPKDENDRISAYHESILLRNAFKEVFDLYDKFVSGEAISNNPQVENYRQNIFERREAIKEIIQTLSQSGAKPKHIMKAVLGGNNPLFSRMSLSNQVNYVKFPKEIYSQQRVASIQWWGKPKT